MSSYRAPVLPETPSSAINHVLHKHFSTPPDNILKAIVAHFVCAQFNSILMAYSALKRGATIDSIQLWAAACALVSLTLALACFLLYKVIMASSFLIQGALQYSLGGLALIGIAMGVAGVMFFDKHEQTEDDPKVSAAAKMADKTLGYEYTPSSSSSYAHGEPNKFD